VTGCFERGNERPVFLKCREFLEYVLNAVMDVLFS